MSPNHLKGDARTREGRRLADRYAGGASIRQLAAETGRSYSAVRSLLIQARVPLRSRGGARARV